jgi:aspartate/methionine/tyrosine aminotransferase
VRTSAEDGFALRAQPFIDAITPATKAIVINVASQPDRGAHQRSRLAAIADAAARARALGDCSTCVTSS